MCSTQVNQHLSKKRIFLILIAILCLFHSQNAQSQTAQELSDLRQDLSNVPNITPESIDTVIEGINLETIDLSEFKEIQTMVENLQENVLDPEILNRLIENVGEDIIPPALGEALSAIEDLEVLTELEDFQDFLELPEVAEALEGLIDDLELPEELAEIVNGIGNIVSDIEATIEDTIDDLAAAVVDSLPDELVDALGGDEAVQSALADALGETEGGLGSTGADGEGGGNGEGGGDGEGGEDGEGGSCGAACNTCGDCARLINRNQTRMRTHMSAEISQHRNWIVSDYFKNYIRPALASMTTQLQTVGLQQVQIIGSFFDAKHQLETQRLLQTMTAQAHKDYHPSEGLCKIGTNTRSLAASTQKASFSQMAIASRMMNRQLSNGDGLSSKGSAQDRDSRLQQFITTYCNKSDHAGALTDLCADSTPDPERINLDINYTNTLGSKLTIEMDALEGTAPSDDAEDIFALSSNLFANEVLPTIPAGLLVNSDGTPSANVNYLLDVRAIAAKRSVAQNSFAAITALKAEGDPGAAPFLKAILAESGISPEDIENRLGENPSYHAQMEVLTKDIYQNPVFYANLYDKPANIERKGTALLAIELMQDRDIYNSLLRSEAVLATLIEVMLQKEHDRISNDLGALETSGTPVKLGGGS